MFVRRPAHPTLRSCSDPQTEGTEIWRWETGDAITGSATVDGDIVYVASNDGTVAALPIP